MTTSSLTRARAGGLIRAHRAGTAGMAEIGRVGGLRGMAAYGDTPQARSLRATDLGSKRAMDPSAWAALMRRRERQFDLPEGSLT